MANQSVSGSFTGTGAGSSISLKGDFNISLSGFGVATVQLQRSFNDGGTWMIVETFIADAQKRGFEPESNVKYRFNASAYTSGTIVHRISN